MFSRHAAALTRWGCAFLLPTGLSVSAAGLLAEVTDPESFLKDLLNSVP